LTLLLDEPWASESVICASLLAAMGRVVEGPVTADDVLRLLAWNRTDPASVVGSLGVARENARRSREIISTELWESINVSWHDATRVSRHARPHAFFSWIRERCAAFNGTVEATLSRDEAYHFLVLGRSIERADMIARLVAARALAGSLGPSWVTLLQSCGAYQAFLRSSQGAVDDRGAVEFLLLDSLFPRSLMTSLVAAERCLDDLSVSAVRGGRAGDEAQRGLGMIRSELEFAPTAELFDDLYQLMERVQLACSTSSDAITRRYFPGGVVTSWMVS